MAVSSLAGNTSKNMANGRCELTNLAGRAPITTLVFLLGHTNLCGIPPLQHFRCKSKIRSSLSSQFAFYKVGSYLAFYKVARLP